MSTTIPNAPTPERVMQLITGGWAAAIVGAACTHRLFRVLEDGADDAAGVAKKANISARGAQALLDGCTGLGLLILANGRYSNTPEAATFLVQGKPTDLGGMAQVMTGSLVDWARLPESTRTGQPAAEHPNDEPDNEFWHVLVPAIAALSFPVAQIAAGRLGIAKAGAVRWLDVGGGSGVWSAVWLGANPTARGTQLDWGGVNRIAKQFVAGFGVGDRFDTIDGDFHTTDFGVAQYEYGIYGHIAHQEGRAANVATFRKFRRAIKPGGTLLVNDFVLRDDRTGHPFAMMFAAQMVLASKEGFAWREADYRAWLAEAGFSSVEFVATPTPATIVLAR